MLQGLFAVLFDSKLQCSYEEKLEVLETVQKICEIACFARRKGILSLDEIASEQKDIFFKSCLLLLMEGVSTEELEEYTSIWMLADNAKGKRLLEMAVIADGVVRIQKGENPKMIFHRLGAWFGSEFMEKFESALQGDGNTAGLDRRTQMLQGLFAFAVLFDSSLQCSYEEKLEVFETVKKIHKISRLAQQEGMLALEDVAAEQEDMFFKSCLLLAAEGASPKELEEYASSWIPKELEEYTPRWMQADSAAGKRLLEMVVIANGVVQIRKSQSSDLIFRRLGAWFGSEFAEKFDSALLEMKQQEKISRIESRREGRLQSEHSFFLPFDAIAEYTPEKILRMIKQVECKTLAIALKGASGQVYRTVMDSISQTEQEALEQEMDIIVRLCDVEYAQKEVLGWEKL